MPPKAKHDAPKKPSPAINRPPISDSSLVYVPQDAIEGYQQRIETGIEWTLLEAGARHHKTLCTREEIPKVNFTQALENKLNKSTINGFLNEESGLSLDQHWDFLLPVTLWDNEKFASEEGKICFHNANCITDDVVKLIKGAVKVGDRKVLKDDLKMVTVLRVNDSQMTDLDKGLKEFKKLTSLNLCGNYLNNVDTEYLPQSIKCLELQANRISNIALFAESLPLDLLYLGLGRNLLTSENIAAIRKLPYNLTVLDLSDNDIYELQPVLEAVASLPNLTALQLSGNPCSLSAGYARTTLMKLQRLQWLDYRQVLPTDRLAEPVEIHPDDLRAAYFHFTVFRIMSAPQPPKAEKGALTTFHIELELPLLDVVRRKFLLFRRNESLTELLPPPEDDDWTEHQRTSLIPLMPVVTTILEDEASSLESDIFSHVVAKNPYEIHNFTIFESNKVPWNKIMNFQEPVIKIFCPDLRALRDTFRSAITVRLIYSITYSPTKAGKTDKKSALTLRSPVEMRMTIASIRCNLRAPDWSQSEQHFHWDDTLGTDEAIHWGDGDLSVIQYSSVPVKVTKGKPEGSEIGARQLPPENLTCHFGVGIDTLRAT